MCLREGIISYEIWKCDKFEKKTVVVAILFIYLLGKVVRDDGGIQAEEVCADRR